MFTYSTASMVGSKLGGRSTMLRDAEAEPSMRQRTPGRPT